MLLFDLLTQDQLGCVTATVTATGGGNDRAVLSGRVGHVMRTTEERPDGSRVFQSWTICSCMLPPKETIMTFPDHDELDEYVAEAMADPAFARAYTAEWDDRQIWGTGDLARYLGGSESSFIGLLLVLIAKADPGNKMRLRLAFPREVMTYDQWQSMSPVPTFAQLRAAMETADVPTGP